MGGRMDVSTAFDASICLPPRLELANRHVTQGEWASGLAIATSLMRCAERQGCRDQGHCQGAASALICELRRLVAE